MRDYKFQQPDLPLPRKRRVLGPLLLKLVGVLLIAGVGYTTYQWLSTAGQKQAQTQPAEPEVTPDSRVIPLPIPPLQPAAAPATATQ